MCKQRKETLAKLDRIVLFLTEQRIATRALEEWENLNEAIWTVRNARKAVIDGI